MPHEQTNLRRWLARLTVPIFIEMVLIILLGTVDTVMLSRCSDNTVAAVGVVVQILNMVFLAFSATTTGTSVLCSQFLGARRREDFTCTVGVSLAFNALVGVAISAFLYFGAEDILRWMDLRPELMGDGIAYMRIVGGFAFVQAISLTLSAVLRSADMAYYPMQVTFVINILNILGNYALIFGHFGLPALGVAGAAISTTISRGAAMGLLVFILFRKKLHFPLSCLRPFPFHLLRKMLAIGLPSGGEQLSYSLSQVVITYFTNLLGNEALAARTYAMNIVTFSYVFAMAVGQGGGICIGHLIGEGRRNAALSLGRYCVRITLMISFTVALLAVLLGRTVMGLLSDNPEVIVLTALILRIDVALELGRAVNILYVNFLRATGDAVYPFIIGLIFMWGVATAGSYVFGNLLGFGLAGMWVAFTFDEGIRAAFFWRRWESRKWMGKSVVGR